MIAPLRKVTSRRCLPLLATPALLLLTAASGYFVDATKNKILPMAEPIVPGTEIVVKRGEVFMRAPVGRAWTAVLGGDLDLAIADQHATVAKDTALVVMRIAGGDASRQLGDVAMVFCSDPKVDGGKAWASLLTLGIAGNMRRTAMATQFCLTDADGDGRVEQAFLVGAKRAEDLKPIPVTPTPVTVARDVPLPGESEARLRFAGVAGLFGSIAFDLEVVEDGRRLTYSNGRSLVLKAKLPREITTFGARFTVLSYDPDTNEARLRLDSGFRPGEYGITTTTTYIPIYVRR